MNLYEAQDEDETSGPISLTYEEYLERKEVFEAQIEISDAARKLASIPEFDLVVMRAYFTEEPSRLGSMMASGRLTPKSFEGCSHSLQSIAHFRNFLKEQLERGNLARSELESLQESYDEAVASGALNTSSMN